MATIINALDPAAQPYVKDPLEQDPPKASSEDTIQTVAGDGIESEFWQPSGAVADYRRLTDLNGSWLLELYQGAELKFAARCGSRSPAPDRMRVSADLYVAPGGQIPARVLPARDGPLLFAPYWYPQLPPDEHYCYLRSEEGDAPGRDDAQAEPRGLRLEEDRRLRPQGKMRAEPAVRPPRLPRQLARHAQPPPVRPRLARRRRVHRDRIPDLDVLPRLLRAGARDRAHLLAEGRQAPGAGRDLHRRLPRLRHRPARPRAASGPDLQRPGPDARCQRAEGGQAPGRARRLVAPGGAEPGAAQGAAARGRARRRRPPGVGRPEPGAARNRVDDRSGSGGDQDLEGVQPPLADEPPDRRRGRGRRPGGAGHHERRPGAAPRGRGRLLLPPAARRQSGAC